MLAAYGGLFEGAIGSPKAIATTLTYSTPYILAGLAVALGFQCGLFNIGAEGQLFMGALAASFVGFTLTGLPIYPPVPTALWPRCVAGAAGRRTCSIQGIRMNRPVDPGECASSASCWRRIA